MRTTSSSTPNAVYSKLDALGIGYEHREHPAVDTVEENKKLRGDLPGAHIKNLFLKDKKGKLWLVVVGEDRPMDMKVTKKRIGAAHLSFGKPDLLQATLGVQPGSVTPLAVINDPEATVQVVVDKALAESDIINCHPLTSTATTSLKASDLLRFFEACGHHAMIVDFDSPPPE